MLFTFRRLEVRRGPILKLRPWRDAPQAIAILERSDPRRDCLKARRPDPQARQRRSDPQTIMGFGWRREV